MGAGGNAATLPMSRPDVTTGPTRATRKSMRGAGPGPGMAACAASGAPESGGRRDRLGRLGPFAAVSLERDAETFHLLDERGALDLEHLGGPGLHPAGVLEGLVEHPLLVVGEDLVEREPVAADVQQRQLDRAFVQEVAR